MDESQYLQSLPNNLHSDWDVMQKLQYLAAINQPKTLYHFSQELSHALPLKTYASASKDISITVGSNHHPRR